MKKLLALGLAFSAMTTIVQKAQAASRYSMSSERHDSRIVDFEKFNENFSMIVEQIAGAKGDAFTTREQKALCLQLEAVLSLAKSQEPFMQNSTNSSRMLGFLRQLLTTRKYLNNHLQQLNNDISDFTATPEIVASALKETELFQFQDDNRHPMNRMALQEITNRLQRLIALDKEAFKTTYGALDSQTRFLLRSTINEYRNSSVALNFWDVLDYFENQAWDRNEEHKEAFAKSFINFIEYVAQLSSDNKQKLLEDNTGKQIATSKFLAPGANYSAPKQLVYAYALLNAGYDAPEFLVATAKLVERSLVNPISQDLLKLLVTTILENKFYNASLSKRILSTLKMSENNDIFLLRYHVILADTQHIVAGLESSSAKRAYEVEQAKLREIEEARLAAWRSEEAQREALRQKAIERERIRAEEEAIAHRKERQEQLRAAALKKRGDRAITRVQQSFRSKKETERRLNERADAFRAQQLEHANKKAKSAAFDELRNQATKRAVARKEGVAKIAQTFEKHKTAVKAESKAKLHSYVDGVKNRAAARKEANERIRQQEIKLEIVRQSIAKQQEQLRREEEALRATAERLAREELANRGRVGFAEGVDAERERHKENLGGTNKGLDANRQQALIAARLAAMASDPKQASYVEDIVKALGRIASLDRKKITRFNLMNSEGDVINTQVSKLDSKGWALLEAEAKGLNSDFFALLREANEKNKISAQALKDICKHLRIH